MMLSIVGITLLGLNDTNKKAECCREGASIQVIVTAIMNL